MEPAETAKIVVTIIGLALILVIIIFLIIYSTSDIDIHSRRHISASTARRMSVKNKKKILNKQRRNAYWLINSGVNKGYDNVVIGTASLPEEVRSELIRKGYTLKDRDGYYDTVIYWSYDSDEDQE